MNASQLESHITLQIVLHFRSDLATFIKVKINTLIKTAFCFFLILVSKLAKCLNSSVPYPGLEVHQVLQATIKH